MKHLQLKDKIGKLHPIFVGPFRVTQESGQNAMKLDLPPYISVYPEVNVSPLTKCYRDQLLPKVVKLMDRVEYRVESILYHWGCSINIISLDRRFMAQNLRCGINKKILQRYKQDYILEWLHSMWCHGSCAKNIWDTRASDI